MAEYFFLYRGLSKEWNTYTQTYQALEEKMASLEYHKKKQPSQGELERQFALIEQEMSGSDSRDLDSHVISLVRKTQLSLEQIQPFTSGDRAGWQMVLKGNYYEFVDFLERFSLSRLPLTIESVDVRSENDLLSFALRLSAE